MLRSWNYIQPFESNCEADVAPGENEFDTPDLYRQQYGDSQREGGWEEAEVGKEGRNRHGKRLDFGWWVHYAVSRCLIELYTWNLYGFINQSHPQ